MTEGVASRRRRLAPGAAVGLDEAMIAALVQAFYAKVRGDPILGPIFNDAIGDGWEGHLAKLCDFWSSVLLMTGRYKGAPMAVHAALPEIRPEHFERWLGLFEETAREICPEDSAALFATKAQMIASSLQLGRAFARGELPPLH